MRDLDDQLRGVDHSHGTRLEELRQRLRLAFLEGAGSARRLAWSSLMRSPSRSARQREPGVVADGLVSR